MKNTLWQGIALSTFLCSLTIQPSNAKHHHHKLHGQQCRTAMSVIPSHFTYNDTAQANAHANTTSGAPAARQISISGIPWQYEGKPVESQQSLTVTLPTNQTTVPGATPSGGLTSTLCLDTGVLYSCTACDRILYGKECYKKTGPDELASDNSGTIACTKWYSRTGYAEGGGVTMCGAESGAIYQCSQDEDLTQCDSCFYVGLTSPN